VADRALPLSAAANTTLQCVVANSCARAGNASRLCNEKVTKKVLSLDRDH